jgi:hypothetical protein
MGEHGSHGLFCGSSPRVVDDQVDICDGSVAAVCFVGRANLARCGLPGAGCWRSLKVAFCDHAVSRLAIIEIRGQLIP